jgi:predicted nucleotidyltransferase
MNIFDNLVSGTARSLKSWKWILIIWFSTLFLAGLLILPAKAAFISVLGSSMITDKLKDGIDIDVLVDFGTNFSTIFRSFSTGFFLFIIFGFLMNVFYNGGLFSNLRKSENRFGASLFFGGAGSNFWSFLVITLIVNLIIFSLVLLIIVIPALMASGSASEGVLYKTFIITAIIFLIILPILLLVADYARVWQAASSKSACFKAIRIGFKQTFKYFFSSYPVMAIVIIIQFLFTWVAFIVISGMKSFTGGGLLLLFLLSHILFTVKIFLRTWRYGSVTAMYEHHL